MGAASSRTNSVPQQYKKVKFKKVYGALYGVSELMAVKYTGNLETIMGFLGYSEEEKNQRSMFDLGGILEESDANNHKYLVDRLVYNFRNVGLIHLIFPNATIIHITRDPMDSLIGTYFHKPDTGSEWTSDFGQTVDYFGAYLEIMNHWESVLPGRIVEVQYEALVFKPHETMGKLLENLGLKSESDQYTPVCTRPCVYTY